LVGTAVVLGGSVAGLLAARVLADCAEQVLVIEPDDVGPGSGGRPGVPQSGQAHVVLPAGWVQLERWFPGFAEHVAAAGATMVPAERTVAYLDGEPRPPAGGDERQVICSRPLLERQIRLRTLALAGVRMITGRGTGLRFDGIAVSAVRYVLPDGSERVQPADLVVDAMGRSSRLGDWLERAGWERPPLTWLPGYLDFVTACFRRGVDQPEIAGATAQFSATGRPAGVAAATVNAVEGGRWEVQLASHRADAAAPTALDFVARCRAGLPPIFAEAAGGELLGEIGTHHHPDSRRRDFHRLIRVPARLVAVGDAVASDNPVHGHGVSSAALHACCLAEYLSSAPDLAKPARAFFELQRVVVDAGWHASTADEPARRTPGRPATEVTWSTLSWATVRDQARSRLAGWVDGQVRVAEARDDVIAGQRAEVRDLLAHPTALQTPAIALRAVLVNQRARLRRRDPAPPGRPAPAD
jgi:2-polyprenyl-6-methoxyphenol hydroxylase-like FAD-dependent oxidoreductase